MSDFEQKLKFGRIGEGAIANWIKQRGGSVLPIYEKQIGSGKGPQLFTPEGGLIAPDLVVFNAGDGKVAWIEAKHKSAFTWHRKTQTWNTGIDQRHYDDYLKVAQISPWPIWLLFLHEDGRAKDTPLGKVGPTGLFGNPLLYLKDRVHHTHGNWGSGGMVYWTPDNLRLLATLDEAMVA